MIKVKGNGYTTNIIEISRTKATPEDYAEDALALYRFLKDRLPRVTFSILQQHFIKNDHDA